MSVFACFACKRKAHSPDTAPAPHLPETAAVRVCRDAATQTTEEASSWKVFGHEASSPVAEDAKVPAVRSAVELDPSESADDTATQRLSTAQQAQNASPTYNATFEPLSGDNGVGRSSRSPSPDKESPGAAQQCALQSSASHDVAAADVAHGGPEAQERRQLRRERNAALRAVFLEFARFGTRTDSTQMDVFRFMKLCRECCLLTSPTDASSIDLVFYKCKAIRANKMTFQEFKQALQHIAVLIGVDKESVVDAIIASQGPLANNITLPMYVKCHDDRERWTGTQRLSSMGSVELEPATPRPLSTPRVSSSRPEPRPRANSAFMHISSTDTSVSAPTSSRYGDGAPRSVSKLPGIAERRAGTYPSHYVRQAGQDGASSGFLPTSARPGSPRGGC